MVCIYCDGKTEVTNSRPQKRDNQVWRRRHCMACDNIFTTIESVDMTSTLLVQYGSSYEPFQREKLLLSIYDALRHRKQPVEDATALTKTAISKLVSSINSATITRHQIINSTAAILKQFDHAAYIQYTAFHPLKD